MQSYIPKYITSQAGKQTQLFIRMHQRQWWIISCTAFTNRSKLPCISSNVGLTSTLLLFVSSRDIFKKRLYSVLARNARKLWSPTFKQTCLIPAGLKADSGKKGMDAAWQQLRDKQNRRNADWPWNLIWQRSGLRSEFHIFWREHMQTRIFKI